MKNPRIAILGLALTACASASALAADGDRWYGSNAPVYEVAVPANTPPVSSVDGDRVYDTEPATVDRDYVVVEPARDVVVYQPYGYVYSYGDDSRLYDRHHPQQGQLVGRGLFNRSGPNDFGQ